MIQLTTATKKLLELKKRVKAIQGGTSASKTFSILLILIDKAQSNPNLSIDVVSATYPHLEGGAIKDFKKILQEQNYWKDEGWNETKHFYTFETGSVIKFLSVDKIGKAKGPRRDILFLNEANHIEYTIADQLMARTAGDIWMDWNPSNEFWYHDCIQNVIDHDFLILTYLDNEALDENTVQYIEGKKDNKRWWTVYGLGILGEMDGRVYTGWQEIDSVPQEARLERRGLDFGYTNDPTALVAFYKWNDAFVFDEELYQKGMLNKQIADYINNLTQPLTIAIADSAEPKSIDELKMYGLTVLPATKGPGSIMQGINFLQSQKVFFTKRSYNLKKEYQNYLFMEDPKTGKIINQPVGGLDHALDACRYAVSNYNSSNYEKYERGIIQSLQDNAYKVYER